ncbi:MAG: hypothetical protein IPP72_11640 [Chitinophagaceae bacterium]|nr:hypothetical protein [Chitinophagaceae bacterium]
MSFIILLFILMIAPLVLAIIGIVFLCNSEPAIKKKGKYLLLSGVLLFLVEILIGYSVCSNMNFH